jgi:ADP-ribosylglycohydrolase
VAHHAPDFEGALWTALRPLGDRDTVGAIVGGIVAARGLRPPAAWVRHREPLPADFTATTGG